MGTDSIIFHCTSSLTIVKKRLILESAQTRNEYTRAEIITYMIFTNNQIYL